MGRRADAGRDEIVRFSGPWRPSTRVIAVCPRVLAVCALLLALGPPRVHAGQAVYAYGRAEAAQQLADAALEFLNVGEDAVEKEKKRSAYEEGLRLARAAVGIDDENADAHFAVFANHGRLQLLDGTVPNPFNLADANRELERTLELDPNHANGLAARGGLYRQLPRLLGGNLNKAEELLTRSIALNANSIGARIELARLYQDLGQPHRSIPLLQAAAAVAKRQQKHRQLADARRLLQELESNEIISTAR